jgi:predicted aspartyl protease
MPDNDAILYIFYVKEEKLISCPQVPICIGNQHITAVIDTGNQICLLTEEMCHKLRYESVEDLELRVQTAVLVSAFRNKAKRVSL